MKVRYGALIALLLTVMVACAFAAVPASADGEVDITVDCSGVGHTGCLGSPYHVLPGTEVGVEIQATDGYYFVAGTQITYEMGGSPQTTDVLTNTDSIVLCTYTATTASVTINVTNATLADTCNISVSVDPAAKCVPEHDSYDVAFNSTGVVKLTPSPGYTFKAGGTVGYSLNGVPETPRTIVAGEENTLYLDIGTITEDTTLEITSVSVDEIQYDVTVTVASGLHFHSEESIYHANYGSTVDIRFLSDYGWYFKNGTAVTITQDVDDISYTTVLDTYSFVITSLPVTGNVTVNVSAASVALSQYVASISLNPFGSTFYESISSDASDPTKITEGELHLLTSASGYLLMSANFKTDATEQYNATKLVLADGSIILFSGSPAKVTISAGQATSIESTVTVSGHKGTVKFTTSAEDIYAIYNNHTEEPISFTYTTGWDLTSATYVAYYKEAAAGAFHYDLFGSLPSTVEDKIYLCPTANGEFTVKSYARVYQGSTLSTADTGVLFRALDAGSSNLMITATVTVDSGYITGVSVTAGSSVESDDKVYVNSGPSSASFTLTSGLITGGYVCEIYSALEGMTRYYADESAVFGTSAVVRSGDIVNLLSGFNVTNGEIIGDVKVLSDGSSNGVYAKGGSVQMTVDDGKITEVNMAQQGLSLFTSTNALMIANYNGAVRAVMNTDGDAFTTVYVSGSAVAFTSLAPGGTSSTSFTVVNGLDVSIDLYNSGGNLLYEKSDGNAVILEREGTLTVCSADYAIANAVSGDDIRIYGNANTTPSRDVCMSNSTVEEPNWDFLKVLTAGVKVNGTVINSSAPKYIHITDGELYVVKYYGYENNTKWARWIYYEGKELLYERSSGLTGKEGSFYYNQKYYAVETPGSTRTYSRLNTVEYAPEMLTDIRELEIHGLVSWGYNNSFDAYQYGRGANLERVYLDGMTSIASYSFQGCNNLKYVYFNGYSVESYAFRYCNYLEDFISPELTRVMSCAFQQCYALKEIHADGINSTSHTTWYVSTYAFDECTSLTVATFNKATYIDSYAFRNCTSLRDVDIPNVISIYPYVYYKCSNLVTVNMPSVVTIYYYAFCDCSSLQGDLYLPAVNDIQYYAFSSSWTNYNTSRTYTDSPKIRNVYAPVLTLLGDGAFGGCTELETISCPILESIGNYTFQYCESLTSFSAPLLDKSTVSYVFHGCTSLTTFSANNAPYIGSCDFYDCSNLRTVEIDAVQTIGTYAFYKCINLESIYAPNVTLIDSYAFTGNLSSSGVTYTATNPCLRLKSVYAPRLKTLNYAAFVGCESLEEVVMTDLISMGQYVFHGCKSLKAFDAPNLTTGSSYMFVRCYALKTVNMPQLSTLDNYNFYECSALETADVGMAQNIGSYAFYKCTSLQSVDLEHVLNIREYSFYHCEALLQVIAREADLVMNNAFESCTELVTVDLDKATAIQSYAFRYDAKLVNLSIPSVTALYSYCFSATGITQLNIGTNASYYPVGAIIAIKDNTFYNCKSLVTVTLGGAPNVTIDTANGSTAAFQSQFSGCSALTTVHIYKISDVSPYMFNQCSNLNTCQVDEAERIWYYSFSSSGLKTLTIGTVTDYIGRTDYNGYSIGASQLVTLTVTGNINCIKWYAFYGFKSLTTVSLKNVGEIQQEAFRYCTSITSFTAADLGVVGNYVFDGCTSLNTVRFSSATSLGSYCFNNCQSIRYFNTTESGKADLSNTTMLETSNYCFSNCKGIQYMNLGSNVTVIPYYCFQNCTALRELTGTNVIKVDIGAVYNCTSLTTISLNSDTTDSVIFCSYDNHPFWYYSTSVSFGGYVVTSNLGRNKTLSLENCTVITSNSAGTSWMAMNSSSSGSVDSGFTHVIVGSNVTIGRNAFYGASLLTDVTIAASLAINMYAFYNCSSLLKVYGGQNITSIEEYGFAFCWKMENIYDDVYYTESMTDRKCLSLPNATEIGDYALYQCYSKDSVSSYYNNTTYGGKYTEVYAPKAKVVGEGAIMSFQVTKVTFGNLQELHNTSFGHRMNTVTDQNFYPCMKLTEFICASYTDNTSSPTKVGTLTTDMFIPVDCVSDVYLTTIGVTGSMNIGLQFQGDVHLDHLILGSPTVVAEAFKGSYISLLEFVGNASVGSKAFENCLYLTTVTADGSPTLGTFCFKGCSNLHSFTATDASAPVFAADVFNGCTELNTFYVLNLPSIADRLFAGLTGLTKINSNVVGYAILNNATTVGATPFQGITLTHIELDSLEIVNSNVFSGMTSVTYLSLKSANEITDDALTNLTHISYLDIGGMNMITANLVNNVSKNNGVLQTVHIEGATMIMASAFEGCSRLNNVYLNTASNAGTVTIGNDAFKNCTALTNIDLRCALGISDYAFCGSKITSIDMPYVKNIGNYAFYNCTDLTTVDIQDCSKFGASCFSCDYEGSAIVSGLESITLNSNSTVLSTSMFKNCKNLKYVNSTTRGYVDLATVIVIGDAAFAGCSNITNVTMPTDMYEIGNYSFDGCSNLIEVVTGTGGNGIKICDYSFRNCSKLANLSFSSVVEIGEYSFQNCVYLTNISMPNLTIMGTNAFEGCSGLMNITMDKLTEVPSHSFSGCLNLRTASMDALKTVGQYAFYNCENMNTFGGTSGVLNLSNVKSVQDYAFYNCNKFTSIDFGVYVMNIGNYSFYNMPSVTQLIFPNSLMTIGNYAFNAINGENHFVTVSIPSSVTNVGNYAFSTMNTVSFYLNGDLDKTGIGTDAFVSNARVNVYLWEEFKNRDLSSFVQGMTVTKYPQCHATVYLRSMIADTEPTYQSGVLMNDGYFVLPYAEKNGAARSTLYFGISTNPNQPENHFALFNVANRYNTSNIAKSGDLFRPVVSYTMEDDINIYYVGIANVSNVPMSIPINAKMSDGITVQAVVFNSDQYHYRDVITLPSFIDPNYELSTIYGERAYVNGAHDQAVFYSVDDGKTPSTVTLGYYETNYVMTVKKFEATVNWYVEGSIWKTDKIYYGDQIGTLPEPPIKSGYHYTCWSTIPGQAFPISPSDIIQKSVNNFYAVYSPNEYTVRVSTDSISGTTESLDFKMRGVFSFTINPLDSGGMPTYGLITYTDMDHLTETQMFDANTWRTGYDFYQYGFSGTSITSKTIVYNDDMHDGDVFEIALVMTEHKYSIVLQFCSQPSPGVYNDLAYSQIRIDPFTSADGKSKYPVVNKIVSGISYRDLNSPNKIIVSTPLYESDETHTVRYTYSSATNLTNGKALNIDENGNLYVNYESFKDTGGVYGDSITIRYVFEEGMYNIKYVYLDDTNSEYINPTTVKGLEGSVFITGIGQKVKTGYTFINWVLLDKDGQPTTKHCNVNESMLLSQDIIDCADNSNTISLQAVWSPNLVTVKYDLGEYTAVTVPSRTVYTDETFTLPSEATFSFNRSGYVMSGWTLVDGGMDVLSVLTLNQNVYGTYVDDNTRELTLYAHWSVKTYTFAVQHQDNDHPDAPGLNRYTNTYSYSYLRSTVDVWGADAIDASEQFKTLIRWTCSAEDSEGTVYTVTFDLGTNNMSETIWQTVAKIAKITGSDTLKFTQVWDVKTFLLYFDTSGGGYLSPNTIGPVIVTDRFDVLSGQGLSKHGYSFQGWYCGTDMINIYTENLVPGSEPKYELTATMAAMAVDGILTFTAVWVQSSYSIEYVMDGGIPTGVLPRNAYYETQVEVSYPTRSGYEFRGWTATGITSSAQYKNGDKWSTWDGTSVLSKSFCFLSWDDESTVVMTALWQQTTYTISYNLNGGSGTVSGGTESATIGEKFTLPELLDAKKTGYTFQGWSYDKVNVYVNSSGKFNEELAGVADENNVVVMYAMWNPITYELWYNYNGNTQQQYVKVTARYDEAIHVEYLEKTGFNFDGWTSTDASTTTSKYSTTGEGENWVIWSNPNYPANASHFKNLASTQDAIVHMVATYTAVTYHVQYDGNGGTGEVPTDVATYNVGNKLTLASYETLVGTNGEKSILGWSTDRNAATAMSVTTFNESIALTADSSNTVTFYAVWIENGCLIKVDLGDATPSYIPSGWKQQADTKYYVKQVEYGSPVKEAMADWDNVTISKEGYVFSSWGYSASTAITDVLVTCNFEKVANNLLYIFIGVFVLAVVAIIVVSRIER